MIFELNSFNFGESTSQDWCLAICYDYLEDIKIDRNIKIMKEICGSAVHAIKKILYSINNRLNNLILITCIRSNFILLY